MQRVIRKWLDTVKDRRWAPKAARRLRELAQRSQDHVPSIVDISFSFKYRSLSQIWPLKPMTIRPLQVPEELLGAAEFLAEQKIRRVLEIGTSSGGTLFVWSWLAGSGGMSISLDLPEGDYASLKPLGNEGYPAWRASLYHGIIPVGHELTLLKGDSHSDEMLEDVRVRSDGEPFDFLFIDGDHSYDGVKRDFEMYSPLVKKGGHVGFHDIVVPHPNSECEVERFWTDIKTGFAFREFVHDYAQGWGGIGILTM